jgi:hypothetical protein
VNGGVANPNGVGLIRDTFIADVDIVIACGEIKAGFVTQGDVAEAAGVAPERSNAMGRVGVAGDVRRQCAPAERAVVKASGIA